MAAVSTAQAAYVPQGRQVYLETLQTLAEASVEVHFDAFTDIDWDAPEHAVVPDDDRWILSELDELGRHPWYRSLPRECRIEIGMYRYAQMLKTGLQFEELLIAGLMLYLVKQRSNRNPEFRYATHEATEETHHTQMFQQLVDRIGLDVEGAETWFAPSIPYVAALAQYFPALFFAIVLAGEEPIDHVQKNILRADTPLHPLMERVISIHVAEEARHIGFAHAYLEQHVPRLDPVRKAVLAVMFPVVLRIGSDAILRPTRKARADMGIPDEVHREIWWREDDSRALLRGLFTDVRMLADRLGLRGPVPRLVWKALRIDGRPARFRSQPVPVQRVQSSRS